MTEHESGPLHVDGSRDERAQADLMSRRRAFRRAMAKCEPILQEIKRAAVCRGCDAYTILTDGSPYCSKCHDEIHASPEAVILIAKPLQKATEEKAGKRFKESVGALILWAFAMVGVCVVGWFAMRGIGWLCFEIGKAL